MADGADNIEFYLTFTSGGNNISTLQLYNVLTLNTGRLKEVSTKPD